MAKGKNPALSPGPYVSKDPEANIAVWSARARLIGVIKRLLPEFFAELALCVFPTYAESVAGGVSYEAWYEPFDQWRAKFHLDFEWLEAQAYRTLEAWRADPALLAVHEWSHPIYSRTPANAPGFRCDGWDMEIETFGEYEKRARAQFHEFLSRGEENARHFASAKGLTPTPRQYSSQNLEWFVLYQFGGMSSVQIAKQWGADHEDWGGDASEVIRGAKAAAKLLAMKLRPGPRAGRKAPPQTESALRNAVRAALNSDDTGAYILAANALDIAVHAGKPNRQ